MNRKKAVTFLEKCHKSMIFPQICSTRDVGLRGKALDRIQLDHSCRQPISTCYMPEHTFFL